MDPHLFNYIPKPKPLNQEETNMEKDITQEVSSTSSTGGSKLSTIFFVVLGLHVLIIIGIGAFHLLKGSSTTAPAVASSGETTEPMTAQPNYAQTETQPVVETQNYSSAPYGQYSPYQTPSTAMGQAPVAQTAGLVSDVSPLLNSPAQQAVATTQASQSMSGELPQPLLRDRQMPHVQTVSASSAQASPPMGAYTDAPVQVPRIMHVSSEGTMGGAATAQPQVMGQNSSQGKSYTVVKGDNLTKIARKTHCRVQALRDVNGLKTDFLKIGQKLTLPEKSVNSKATQQFIAAGKTGTSKLATRSTAKPSQSGYGSYKVVKGDTLVKIAKSHGTTAAKLAQINQINDPTKLQIGIELKVPSQTATSKPAFENTQAAVQTAKPFRTPANQTQTDVAMLRSGEQQ